MVCNLQESLGLLEMQIFCNGMVVMYKVHGSALSRLLWFDLFHLMLLVALFVVCMFILWFCRAGSDVLDVFGSF